MVDRMDAREDRTLAQLLAMVFGLAFLAVGILGFIPGITTNYDELGFAGSDSQAELLGIFQISVLHNIVHLLFGAAGVWASRAWDSARMYLLGAGLIYLVLVIYGVIVGSGDANFVPLNTADDILHAGLAVGLLGSYFVTRDELDTVRTRRDPTVSAT